jgi:hypothetical protein
MDIQRSPASLPASDVAAGQCGQEVYYMREILPTSAMLKLRLHTSTKTISRVSPCPKILSTQVLPPAEQLMAANVALFPRAVSVVPQRSVSSS